MLQKIKNLITQDVKNDNEVKMYAVIMRIILIIFACYSIIGLIYSATASQYGYMAFEILLICATLGLFTATYCNRTRLATVGTWLMFAVLMVVNSRFYGINSGVFQIIYIMIIMIFTLDYFEKVIYKILSLAAALVLRWVLYGYFSDMRPIYGNDLHCEAHWQALHLIAFSGMVIVSVVTSTADFSEMRKKLMNTNMRFRDMAGKDPLTGMYNRRATLEYLNSKVKEFTDGTVSAITVVMADIDHFKNVNDTYGHDNGDIVLVTLSDVMGAFMRGRGIPSRWGGEEFVLVFINMNGDAVYQELFDLRKQINSKTFNFSGDEIKVTLTYGVAEYGAGDDIEAVIKDADEKLYIGKEKGRNVVIF